LTKECFIIYSFFIRNIPRNHWQAKWETIWIYSSAIFFVYFFKIYADACYVFESLDNVSWMTLKWNAMHVCASHGTYSLIC